MQLTYSEQELMRDHPDLQPQVILGQRVHGGFDDTGAYCPPRAFVREQALDAWSDALIARGGEVFDADSSLLALSLIHISEPTRLQV